MPWPVYSTRFARTAVQGVWQYYTVPPGMRAVLRCVTAFNGGATAGRVFCTVAGTYIVSASLPAGQSLPIVPWMVVLYSSEELGIFIEVPVSGMTASGFLFADPSAAVETPLGDEGPAPDPPLEQLVGMGP